MTNCILCGAGAVTMTPVTSLLPIRPPFRHHLPDGATEISVCGTCCALYSDDTLPADGPPRTFAAIATLRETSGQTEARRILRDLEAAGYQIFIRSDGRQLIMSHENGLDRTTRALVETYRKEITALVIERLQATR